MVTVEVVDGGLLVKPKPVGRNAWVLPFSEAELVAGLTPASAHADELPTVLPSETGQ